MARCASMARWHERLAEVRVLGLGWVCVGRTLYMLSLSVRVTSLHWVLCSRTKRGCNTHPATDVWTESLEPRLYRNPVQTL